MVGCPRPEVFWYKNDIKMIKDDKVVLDNPTETQYYLTIEDCDRLDSCSYTIKASNEHGQESVTFEVQVVDVPEEPRGPSQEVQEITLEAE